MALTPAEKQKRYRERQKATAKAQNIAVSDPFRTPFFEWFNENTGIGDDFFSMLDYTGIEPPEFNDDSGPRSFLGQHEIGEADESEDRRTLGRGNSLRRAEIMIECLAAAAIDLARCVGNYKRAEIEARLAEIEASDLSDPNARKAALQDAARLNKMLDQLDKQVRLTFPEWKVMG